MEKIVSLCKRRGFVFQSSEIYGGFGAVYDYGPLGIALKNNISQLWWRAMTQLHENIVGLDSGILMHPKIWEASGHVENFNDPMIDDKNTWERFRVDKLIEEKIEEFKTQLSEEEILSKLNKEFWVNNLIPESWTFEQMKAFVEKYIPNNPITWKKANWTDVRKFNLMFKTHQWVIEDDSTVVYLRPETAQWIFVNFKNILDTTRVRIPFGIAQIWKSFRNEISPREFLFRAREFEQMEMQYFVKPGTDDGELNEWKEKRYNFMYRN